MKPFAEFHQSKGDRFGLRSACKPCEKIRYAAAYPNRRATILTKLAAKRRTEGIPVLRKYNTKEAAKEAAREQKRGRYHGPAVRARRLLRQYGIDEAWYHFLFIEQDGRCRICNRDGVELVVDHSHSTGQVRGLLCNPCNAGLGMFKDTREHLMQAIAYLDNPPAPEFPGRT